MLIGRELEKETQMTATRMCANHLADQVRNIYLKNKSMGFEEWEEAFCENDSVIPSLREEGFRNVQGIDYLFRWWGESADQELAGELIVIWKVRTDDGEEAYYRTWVKLAERDFVGPVTSETKKRAAFREEFAQAFAVWKKVISKNG